MKNTPVIISLDKTTRLLQRLDDSLTSNWWSECTPYVSAILYGVVAYLQGSQFFIIYCGLIGVLVLTISHIEAKQKKQTELIKEILEELKKTKTEPAG